MTSINFSSTSLACVVAAGVIIAAGPAAAQDSAASSNTAAAQIGGTLDEITVTARRTSERLQDVPLAITALTAEDLEQRGVRSLENLQLIVPAMRVTTFSNPDALVVGIRGQRNSQIQPGQDPSIGVYFADVPTGFQLGLNAGLFDLSDIQVLKGPQGTLFGRNSTGGAVLINPQKPTGLLEGYVKAQGVYFEEGEGYGVQGVLNLPVSDTLALRFGVDALDRDGYIKNVAGPYLTAQTMPSVRGPTNLENLGDQDTVAWRAGVRWTPSDSVENYTVYQGVRYRSHNGVGNTLTAVNPSFPIARVVPTVRQFLPEFLAVTQAAQRDYFWTTMTGAQAFVEVDSHLGYNTTTWNIGSLTVKNIAGYKWLRSERFQDTLGIPYQMLQQVYDPQRGAEWSEELQLQGRSFSDRLKWVIGAFYFDNYYDSGTQPSIQFVAPGSLGPSQNVRIGYTDNITQAVFAQGTYAFAGVEGLSLTLGARYTRDERRMSVTNYNNYTTCALLNAAGQRLPITDCFYHGEEEFSEPTYLASLDYKIDPQTLIYLSAAHGYRSGGFNVASATVASFEPFDAETVDNYEIGLKKDWSVGAVDLRTNLAAYFQDYQDVQRIAQDTRPGAVSTSRLFNATKAEVTGGELELTAQLTPDLAIGATYAHVNPKYKASFFVAAPTGGLQDVALNTFSQVPKDTYGVNVQYELPLPAAVGEFALSADYAYQSRFYFDDVAQGSLYGPLEAQSQKAYGITNARLDWKRVFGSKVDLGLWASNLTNEEYYTSSNPVYTQIGAWPGLVGVPRMYFLQAKYSFAR